MADWCERDIEDEVVLNPESVWWEPCVAVGVVGRQITLPSGLRLDVLLIAREPEVPRLIVVEIKQGEAGVSALLQLVGYMEEVCRLFSGIKVSGILLASDHTDDAMRLVRTMPSVSLSWYQAALHIDGVHPEFSGRGELRGHRRGGESFDEIRAMVRDTYKEVSRLRNRRLPVRLDDIPSRIYRHLP